MTPEGVVPTNVVTKCPPYPSGFAAAVLSPPRLRLDPLPPFGVHPPTLGPDGPRWGEKQSPSGLLGGTDMTPEGVVPANITAGTEAWAHTSPHKRSAPFVGGAFGREGRISCTFKFSVSIS